jgi:hypothetical protein
MSGYNHQLLEGNGVIGASCAKAEGNAEDRKRTTYYTSCPIRITIRTGWKGSE